MFVIGTKSMRLIFNFQLFGKKLAEKFLNYHGNHFKKGISRTTFLKFLYTFQVIESTKSTYISVWYLEILRVLLLNSLVYFSLFFLCFGLFLLLSTSQKIFCPNVWCTRRRGFQHTCTYFHVHEIRTGTYSFSIRTLSFSAHCKTFSLVKRKTNTTTLNCWFLNSKISTTNYKKCVCTPKLYLQMFPS